MRNNVFGHLCIVMVQEIMKCTCMLHIENKNDQRNYLEGAVRYPEILEIVTRHNNIYL